MTHAPTPALRAAVALSVLLSLVGHTARVAAHHSTSMFDISKVVKMTGVVQEVRWTNPHVTLLVDAAAAPGEASSQWLLETTSPGNLNRAAGWPRTAIKTGDRVEFEMNPLREDTRHGGRLTKITLVATGQSFSTNIGEPQERPGLN